MYRALFALSLFAASAGLAHAEPAAPETVAVKIAGMTPQEARAALRAAARQVCQTADANEVNGPVDCYNATMRTALDNLEKAERSQSLHFAQTASR